MATYNIDFQSQGSETNPTIPGKASISLPRNTLNTSATSLALTGQGLSLYGEFQQENFIRLLENFASKIAPANPTVGQLWFDTSTNLAKIYDMNQQWVEVGSGVWVGTTVPENALLGQLWFNTTEQILYMRKGTTGAFSADFPRYFGGEWVQVWPTVLPYAYIEEYNNAATRINRVIGDPITTGADPDIALNQWGWGQTDTLPIFSTANNPTQFDNIAWVRLLSRLMKATRHIDQTLAPESAITQYGFIQDGRGDNDTTALTYSPSYLWKGNWGGSGLATVTQRYNDFQTALTALETNRFTMSTLDTTWVAADTTSRPSWTSTKVYTATVQFGSENAARTFFNSGGQLRFNISLTGGTTGNAANWVNLFTNNGTNVSDYSNAGFVIDFRGCRLGPAGAYIGGASSIGYYDLTTSYQLLHQVSRGGAYGAGGLQFRARRSSTSGWTVDVEITFEEDLNLYAAAGVNGTTSVMLQFRRPTGSVAGSPTINSPAIATPTVITSGTFKTVGAE
jgi:hypothetical protein